MDALDAMTAMTAMTATISFYAAAVIGLLAGLVAVVARRSDHALAGFAIALAAMLIPLIQLGASAVVAALLLAVVVIVALLGTVARIASAGPGRASPRSRAPIVYWVAAGLGVLGFAWVALATGSRQVVDLGESHGQLAQPGDGGAVLLELGTEFVVPALLVALLALSAVIAAVLGDLGFGQARGDR